MALHCPNIDDKSRKQLMIGLVIDAAVCINCVNYLLFAWVKIILISRHWILFCLKIAASYF